MKEFQARIIGVVYLMMFLTSIFSSWFLDSMGLFRGMPQPLRLTSKRTPLSSESEWRWSWSTPGSMSL
jgi:hypothetical protein